MEIDILDTENFLDSSKKNELYKNSKKILNFLGLSNDSELSISVIDDVQMRKLNKNYRNIDRTTDILSFSQQLEKNNNVLGDLVISYETAYRHSEKYGVTINQELKKLLVHGILHLLGHDHKKKKEKEIMRKKEKEILNFLS